MTRAARRTRAKVARFWNRLTTAILIMMLLGFPVAVGTGILWAMRADDGTPKYERSVIENERVRLKRSNP